jgi:hypothetical protein
MTYSIESFNADNIVSNAVIAAQDACTDISKILADIQDNALTGAGGATDPLQGTDNVPLKYGANLTSDMNITDASGAMVIDDLMQKISTKVQVASQLLSTANNIAKTASRVLSQG